MDMVLHTQQDDWNLRSTGDLERTQKDTFAFPYNLTDPDGNKLTDPSGNYLIALFRETLFPQVLHSTQDDLNLRAE